MWLGVKKKKQTTERVKGPSEFGPKKKKGLLQPLRPTRGQNLGVRVSWQGRTKF